MDRENRVIILIDMDCFYCQVEEKLNPKLKGKPIAVVQYNPWKGGGIIAVNYVARAMGVTRHMRGDEAKEKCPEIELPSVPCLRGKADITKYREAGKEVARVLQKFTPLLERASIDEAYMDITATVDERLKSLNVNTITTAMMPNTYALGYECVDEFLNDVHACGVDNIDFDYEHAKRLLVGAVIVTEIRGAVFEETGYRCSAGISHNKTLAKLVCGMNKPNKQTVLPKHCINILYKTLPIKKVKHLGGKFGDMVCEILKVSKMCELQMFPEKELQARFDEKNGTWLYNIARGIDFEPVQARFNPKSIGCCKQFRGKSALVDLESLRKWLKDLGDEIDDRLEKDALENNRTPKQMVVSYSTQLPDGRDTSSSRSYNFVADDELCGELFSNKALDLLMESCEGVKVKDGESNRSLKAPIKFLGISVGKFEDISEIKKTKKILDYFGASSSKVATDKTKENKQENITNTGQENNKPLTKDKNKTDVKSSGKHYVMKKFLQTGDKDTQQIPNNYLDKNALLESSLDKQESFFAKMLNGNLKDLRKYMESEKQTNRPTTPVCDVKCGDDSTDTDYSGSTINMEINKSIALFEEDPQEISRVSSIRNLLNKSQVMNDEETETTSESEESTNVGTDLIQVIDSPHNIETFQCTECRKTITINMAAEHADYHFALSLRDEQRQQIRKEIKENNINRVKRKEELKKIEEACDRNETVSSIATFLIKIDSNIPTEVCSECGKRIPIEKFSEHLDFHEARKLSRQLNRETSPLLTNSNIKRKRKSTSSMKKNKMPCRPIDSFFR